MSSLGGILLVFVIISIACKKIMNEPVKRPGPAAQPAPANAEPIEETDEDCADTHEGEASHDSGEGFSAAKKPQKKAEVHAFNRAAQRARAVERAESAVPAPAPRAQFTAAEARRAFVMSEILSKPVSMRENNE